MKLRYWVADRIDDSTAFSVRARTRDECVRLRKEAIAAGGAYGKPREVEIEYLDLFDLACTLLSDMGEPTRVKYVKR